MAKRRKLQDLYVTGREVEVTGPKGSAVVWLQKLTPIDQEAVLRRAGAARARMLMLRRDENSEEYAATYSEVSDYGDRDVLIGYLVNHDLTELRMSREAELAASEEWSKDDYLQGLRDSWEGLGDDIAPLRDAWVKDPEDPEASRVFLEMKRFADTIDEQMEAEVEVLKRNFEGVDDHDIIKKVVDLFMENKADAAWMRESGRAELFYAVRDPDDHTLRYFDKKEELDLLDPSLVAQLTRAYRELVVDPMEGKGSAETDGSSPSSELSAQEATADSSGLQGATP